MRRLTIVLIICLLLAVGFNVLLHMMRNSNPYVLILNEEYIDTTNREDSLYRVSLGDIKDIAHANTEIVLDEHYKEVSVSRNEAESYYVGQFIAKENNQRLTDLKGELCNVRIVEKSENDDQITVGYVFGGEVEISFNMDGKYLNMISEKTEMIFKIEGQTFEYRLKKISKDVVGGQFGVVVNLLDEDALTRNGQQVDVEVIVEEKKDVVVVPEANIMINKAGEETVLVRTQSGYEYRKIATGIRQGNLVEVIRGLSEGEVIFENE